MRCAIGSQPSTIKTTTMSNSEPSKPVDSPVGLPLESRSESPLLGEEIEESETVRRTERLEAKVKDLETKLATLSRLLQVYQGPPEKEEKEIVHPLKDPSRKQDPPFESPHKRNLSFRLLYNDNPEEYNPARNRAPVVASLTPAERRWYTRSSPRVPPPTEMKHKWLNYLNSFQDSTPDVDVQMEEFIKVPNKLEGTMSFGFLVCADAFLYMITILPVRFIWSCLLLFLRLFWSEPSPAYRFHRQHSYQMVQVAILFFIYNYVLVPISIGKLYHWIRGQAMIKLYVLISIVEVFDRLFCSLGQDCLDSMYWNTVNRPRSSRMIISILVVLVYATLHTLILFVHTETINVAMNSSDQALLTLLISGNFAEIKTNVFKKYNKAALFKITAADICERFKLGLFLFLVWLLNISQGMDGAQQLNYLKVCAIVWAAELIADSIKHSFISKFNFLSASVYPEFSLLLAGDVTGIGHEGVNLDHSHAVVKRIGFAQIPLVAVFFRMLREARKYAAFTTFWGTLSTASTVIIATCVWIALVGVKVALGELLHRASLSKLLAAPEIATPKKKVK